MGAETLVTFTAVAALAYVTPGPDWFVVMRHAATSRRSGLISAIGVQSGLLVHMVAAAIGVAAVLLSSALAFTVLKLVGAAYLIVLGVKALRDSFGSRDRTGRAEPHDEGTFLAGAPVWRQSFVANVLNPKAALFFVAVLPQFISSERPVAGQVVLLGTIDIAIGVIWWFAFVYGIRGVQHLLGEAKSWTVLDRVSGAALIGLGGLLAFSGRRLA